MQAACPHAASGADDAATRAGHPLHFMQPIDAAESARVLTDETDEKDQEKKVKYLLTFFKRNCNLISVMCGRILASKPWALLVAPALRSNEGTAKKFRILPLDTESRF